MNDEAKITNLPTKIKISTKKNLRNSSVTRLDDKCRNSCGAVAQSLL